MTIPCVRICLLAGCCIAIPPSSNNNKHPSTSFSSSASTGSKYPYTILSSTASECSKQQNSTNPCLQKSLATLPSCCRMDLAGFNSQLSAASLGFICLFWTIFWAVSNSRMRQDFPAFSYGSQEAHHNHAGILNLHANSRKKDACFGNSTFLWRKLSYYILQLWCELHIQHVCGMNFFLLWQKAQRNQQIGLRIMCRRVRWNRSWGLPLKRLVLMLASLSPLQSLQWSVPLFQSWGVIAYSVCVAWYCEGKELCTRIVIPHVLLPQVFVVKNLFLMN